MIKDKKDLKRYLNNEKRFYIAPTLYQHMLQVLTCDSQVQVYKFIKYLRHEEYHHNQSGPFHKLLRLYYWRKRRKLGNRLGLVIWDNSFDEGLFIYHAGNIVVNGSAKIGKNCKLHGSNCIGNNGKTLACPTLGNNVRLGVGAKVIGDVTIADDVIIAAGAVVVHSVLEPGITVAGVPARKVSKSQPAKPADEPSIMTQTI